MGRVVVHSVRGRSTLGKSLSNPDPSEAGAPDPNAESSAGRGAVSEGPGLNWVMIRPGVWRARTRRGLVEARRVTGHSARPNGQILTSEAWEMYGRGRFLGVLSRLPLAQGVLERWGQGRGL